MGLVQVDVVRAQAPQAVFDSGHDPASRVPATVWILIIANRVVKLRARDHAAPPTSQGFADDSLVLAVAVGVGCVDEIDSRV